MQKKFAKSSFWFLLGSFLLLLTLVLPFVEASSWGISVSLFLSWCILLLSFQEEGALQKSLLNRTSELEKDILDLQNAKESVALGSLEKEQEFKQERVTFEKKIKSLQEEVLKKEELIKNKDQEILSSQEKLARSKELLDALNEKRVENFQLSLLHDSFARQNLTQETEIKNLKDILDNFSEEEAVVDPQLERDFKQLKKQFDEKTEVLNQTRKDLFQLEGRLLAFQKEREDKETEINPAEVVLSNHLKEVEEECKGLEVEVAHLQEFISKLLAKKTPGRKKKLPAPTADLELNF